MSFAVGVRTLCEFAARTGGLEFRYTPAPTAEEGITGHLTVQQRRPDPYVAEYPLKGMVGDLEISGRVDGYYAHQRDCFLEEIKTHRGNINRIGPGRRALHWAQLKVYGALLCRRDKRNHILLRLTYFEVRDELETVDEQRFEAAELDGYLHEVCQRYVHWAQLEQLHRLRRDNYLRKLDFPYDDFRRGQRELSESVYRAAVRGVPLLLQAPTGIGKTLGVLYPALKSMPAAGLDRAFFLTCRNTGRRLALDGVTQLFAANPREPALRVLELSSREAACDHPDKACHGESCPLARDFFEKLPAARERAVEVACLDQQCVRDIAAEFGICRYFLAQEMARWCDLVIADVNHYYDQFALLHSLTQQYEWRVMTLVDEAHNLIDRARSMYSVTLSEAEMLYSIRSVPGALLKPLSDLESAWAALIAAYPAEADDSATTRYFLPAVPEILNTALYSLIAAITDFLTDQPAAADVQHVLFTALAFLRLADKFDQHSLCTLEYDVMPGGDRPRPASANLRIDNLIPADHLETRFAAASSTVLFSATLSPPEYHRDLLGTGDQAVFVDIESPFSAAQIDLRLVTGISTRRAHRDESLQPICDRISAQFDARAGNYLVYVSSFEYLNALYDTLKAIRPALRLIRQRPGMPPLEREQFIADIADPRPSIGFAVLGGIFGEGIDLPGEKLIGVFVATLGLPPHDDLHEVLRERLEDRYGRGYDYTYVYPGLQKVIQAAGRLIRTPEDSGVIELIDHRFGQRAIRALFPAWWQSGGDAS